MPNSSRPAKVLTIAGSDSGGAAGLQADLKTWTALGVYGMSVVTAVTAQNSVGVNAVHYLPADFVRAQLDAVLSDYGAAAIKTGFIGRVDVVEVIAGQLAIHQQTHKPVPLIIDPVLVNHRGQSMFAPAVANGYVAHLLPLAELITPNCHEAALLSNTSLPEPTPLSWLEAAARRLQRLGPRYVLVKGGRDGANLVDVLFDGATVHHLPIPWLDTPNTHGSGDALSAAICAYLAQGDDVLTAVQKAQQFTAAAIRKAVQWQLGRGHGPLAYFVKG